jgi:ADP-ribosyl-[dinitrogen reductase] hydrolase
VIFISSFLRAAGALAGLAIGDALGAPLEGSPPPLRKVTEMEDSEKYGLRTGQYTDDTGQALAVADSLSICRGFSAEDMMRRLVRNYLQAPQLYGPTSSLVFELVLSGMPPSGAARAAHRANGSSRSNGSVMRGPPIGIFYAGPMVEACSEACARLTHYDPINGACSSFLNRMVSDLCRGYPKDAAYARAVRRCRHPEVMTMLGDYRRYEPVPALDALLATHAAVFLFMQGRGFEDVVVDAINLGGDADTIGAMAGSLAGAADGLPSIPGRWLARLEGLPVVMESAWRLWAAARE